MPLLRRREAAPLPDRSARRPATPGVPSLRIDPVACEGVGICAHLAPDVVSLDQWGYPVIAPLADERQVRQAGAAAQGCPRRALFVE